MEVVDGVHPDEGLRVGDDTEKGFWDVTNGSV